MLHVEHRVYHLQPGSGRERKKKTERDVMWFPAPIKCVQKYHFNITASERPNRSPEHQDGVSSSLQPLFLDPSMLLWLNWTWTFSYLKQWNAVFFNVIISLRWLWHMWLSFAAAVLCVAELITSLIARILFYATLLKLPFYPCAQFPLQPKTELCSSIFYMLILSFKSLSEHRHLH